LIGASGNVGGRILAEALQRGHSVVGIVRHPEKLSAQPRFTIARGDIANPAELAKHLRGADVVVASVRWADNVPQLLDAVRQSGVPRLIAVIGAGSLEASPGVRVIDTPEFPAAWRSGAEARRVRSALSLREGHRLVGGFAVLEYHARRAHRQISSRRRSAVARFGRREPHLARGLRGGHCR